MEKKIRDLHFRIDHETHQLINAVARKEGMPTSKLLQKIVADYVNKDINIQNALLASNNKLILGVCKLQQEMVILYKNISISPYFYFYRFGKSSTYRTLRHIDFLFNA